MQKPTGITITTALMCLFLIIGIVITFARPLPIPANSAASPSMIATLVHVGVIVYTLIAAICIWFYWSGKEWARWVVMIDCLLVFISLRNIGKAWGTSHLNAEITIGQVLLAIFLLYYLNTAPIRAWFSGKEPTAV